MGVFTRAAYYRAFFNRNWAFYRVPSVNGVFGVKMGVFLVENRGKYGFLVVFIDFRAKIGVKMTPRGPQGGLGTPKLGP